MPNSKKTIATPWGQGETQHFFSLTPDVILTAAERTGRMATGRCLALGSMENRVYEVEVEPLLDKPLRTPAERFLVVKFYRPGRWTREQIQEEHDFLFDLIDDEINVVAPLRDEAGESVFLDSERNLLFAIFPKIGGRSPDELSGERYERVGSLIARMHLAGGRKKAPHRVTINPETYGQANLQWILQSPHTPMSIRSEYEKAASRIIELSRPLFTTCSTQRIHGDAHLGNLLWNDYGPFWVDFDDMVTGPCVQDLWLILPGRDDYAVDMLRHLLKGYEMLKPFDRASISLIEPLRALRFIHFAAWIGKRWEDPTFQRGFPQYLDERWWQGQIRDLQESSYAIAQGRTWQL